MTKSENNNSNNNNNNNNNDNNNKNNNNNNQNQWVQTYTCIFYYMGYSLQYMMQAHDHEFLRVGEVSWNMDTSINVLSPPSETVPLYAKLTKELSCREEILIFFSLSYS